MYVDDNHLLVEWVYRQGGSEMPTRISTWEKNQKVGPILISMEHQGKDENFRVWFTDVKAKLKGSDRWVTPK
jgi:hypothetical protein